jgi:hypothetical protein
MAQKKVSTGIKDWQATYLASQLFAFKPAKIFGKTYPVKRMPKSKLRYYDLGSNIFIEQNPATASKYAAMAKKGTRIAWLMTKKGGRYLILVANGKTQPIH